MAEAHFSAAGLLRLVMLIGFYSMMTDAWAALDVSIDDAVK
jgi:hypothetical protein